MYVVLSLTSCPTNFRKEKLEIHLKFKYMVTGTIILCMQTLARYLFYNCSAYHTLLNHVEYDLLYFVDLQQQDQ